MRLSIQTKLFYSHFVAVVLVSGSIGTLFYSTAMDSLFSSLQTRLKYSAALLSRTIDAVELEGIRGPDDVRDPAYQRYLDLLREFRRANRDIAFIYVMRREGDRALFVIDSDSSEEQALPGQVYTEDLPNLWEGFTRLAADEAVNEDQWGYFLSGYAPLKNGEGRYLVGIDMRADEVQRKFRNLRVAGIVSLVLSVLLAYFFSRLLAARITRPIKMLAGRSGEIASGVLGGQVPVTTRDELADLAASFNTMSRRLEDSHRQNRTAVEALEESRSTLELRVVERTARLAELNEQLVAEIEERKRAEEALARAATTDYLTDLLNRRAMLAILEQEEGRFERDKNPFSLLLADLDHFKAINDTHGHHVGDEVLIHVANLMRKSLRGQDAIARWGGEELLILLPETGREGALEVAEKLRRTLAEDDHAVAGVRFRITASVGVSVMVDGMSIRECIRRADIALYRAKSEGRNRTVCLD